MRPFILTLALLAATPTLAQSPRQAMFPGDQGCYLRHYTAAHLADHPDQMVREIALGPEPAETDARFLALRLAVSLRGSDDHLTATAYCENTGGDLSCQLEGDGGWFTLSPGKNGALRLSIPTEPLGFETATGFVTFGGEASDDRLLALHPVPADSCP